MIPAGVLLLMAASAAAQATAASSYDRAIAAGYKALTLCSGVFNAGRTQAEIEALELIGIYPEYDAIVPALAARVDRGQGRVEVPYDATLPPRRAQWTAGAGCAIMPIGSEPAPASPAPPPLARATDDPRPWPMGDAGAAVRTPPPAPVGRRVDAAFAGGFGAGTRTTGLVVVEDGRIVAERYAAGFGPHVSQRTWSVAKSLSGTLLGHAVLRGTIAVKDPAPVPQWSGPGDPRAGINFDNLLRMASGLHSATAGNRTDAVYFGGTAVSEETVAWPLEARPGTRFRYANNDILLAVMAARAGSAGNDAALPSALFGKLGMAHTVAERDWKGNYILSSQVWSTARDLARFGMLYLGGGVWNGERLLPEDWVRYATTPSGPQPEGEFGYGATFWLMNRSAGVPADTFAAFGNRGQYVVIVPSRNIVIVRRGEDPAGARFDIAKFTADLLAALPPDKRN